MIRLKNIYVNLPTTREDPYSYHLLKGMLDELKQEDTSFTYGFDRNTLWESYVKVSNGESEFCVYYHGFVSPSLVDYLFNDIDSLKTYIKGVLL